MSARAPCCVVFGPVLHIGHIGALVTINEKLSVLLETRENCARRESDTG